MFVWSLVSNSKNRKEAKQKLDKALDYIAKEYIKVKGIEEGSQAMNRLKTFDIPYLRRYASNSIDSLMVVQ